MLHLLCRFQGKKKRAVKVRGHRCGSITVCLRADEILDIKKRSEPSILVLNTEMRRLCKCASRALGGWRCGSTDPSPGASHNRSSTSCRIILACSTPSGRRSADLSALRPACENTFSGERFIHLQHAERLKSLSCQSDSRSPPLPLSVAPRNRHLNK